MKLIFGAWSQATLRQLLKEQIRSGLQGPAACAAVERPQFPKAQFKDFRDQEGAGPQIYNPNEDTITRGKEAASVAK